MTGNKRVRKKKLKHLEATRENKLISATKIKRFIESRQFKILVHNLRRKVALISGTPMPNELRIRWLETNHTRKKIYRKGTRHERT